MRSIDEPRFIDDVSVRVRIRRNRGWPSASGLLTSATVLVSLVSAKPAFAERVASTPAAARPAAAEPTAKVGGISEGGRACVPSRMTNSFRSRSCAVWTVRAAAFRDGRTGEPAAATAKAGGISEGGRACVPSRMTNSFRSRSCAVWTVRAAAFRDGRTGEPAAAKPAAAEPAAKVGRSRCCAVWTVRAAAFRVRAGVRLGLEG
jgi:hypothetical protein